MPATAQSRSRKEMRKQILEAIGEVKIKKMNAGTSNHDVSLQRPPAIGSIFTGGAGKRSGVYTVANVGAFKPTGKTETTYVIYWVRHEDGKLFASGVRQANLKPIDDWECIDQYADQHMHKDVAIKIGLTRKAQTTRKKTLPRKNAEYGVTVMHKNPLSQRVEQSGVKMRVMFKHPTMDIIYWIDQNDQPYWSTNANPRNVRPFHKNMDIHEWMEATGNKLLSDKLRSAGKQE